MRDIGLEIEIPASPAVADGFPIPVVPDWDEQLRRADAVCRLIDRHLNYEAQGRCLRNPANLLPGFLCPEQRVQMLTDLYGAAAAD